MDGHEHEDVVDYLNRIFLPAIAQFEAQMARHEGPELKKIMPELQEGQHRIIIQYHDESAVSRQTMRHKIFGCKKGSSHFEKRARAS